MNQDRNFILIAEDNDDDFFILKRALGKARIANPNFRTSDGQETVSYLSGEGPFADRTAYPRPCLLLLDLKLPIKHGFDVLQWIRHDPVVKTIPVLVLSASQEPSDIRKAYELGANAFLTKPTSVDSLVEIAQAITLFWLQKNTFDPALY